MSEIYPSHFYQDPAIHAKYEQEKPCKGCAWNVEVVTISLKKEKSCAMRKPNYPRRCGDFIERKT